jgi:galactose mutarotase-like enzyme
MMDIIELYSGATRAIIDPLGAWLTNLSDDNGDILFPRRQLTAADGSAKTRGGCHICLPNFGPGGKSGLPQHGFGRVLPWRVIDHSDASATLLLQGGAPGYEGLQTTIQFVIKDSSLSMMLSVENNGSEPLRVAPAFHPYFSLTKGEGEVKVDERTHVLAELAGTEFEDGDGKTLVTPGRHIHVTSRQLPTWAIWTDMLGDYVCVEPTYGGYSFLNAPAPGELLQPGASATYECTISW